MKARPGYASERMENPLSRLMREHKEFGEASRLRLARIEALERRLMACLSLDDLKVLWDSYDGLETSDPVISGEMVHAELNRRGHGDYCPI